MSSDGRLLVSCRFLDLLGQRSPDSLLAHLGQNGLLCDALDEQRIVQTILARNLDFFTSAVQLFG